MNLFDRVSPEIRNILDSALDGHEVSWQDALRLCHTDGLDFQALTVTADELRRRQVGDVVTYVVNRNVNFTNVCVKHCGFCAFSRTYRNEQGYFLPLDEIIRRATEAVDMGATELCMQAGLPPDMDGGFYVDLTREVKRAFPEPASSCVLSRRSVVRRNTGWNHHPGFPRLTQERRSGFLARYIRGNSRPGNPRCHIAWPHHGPAMD